MSAMLPRDVARRVRLFQVRTRKLMESGLGGEFRSVFRGRGVEFDEVRPYVPGDDVRLIDWNVTARTDDPHIKKHVEDREQTVVLAVDVSASSAYGGEQTKREYAAEICCVLGLAAAAAGDRTALLLFSDRVERFVAPSRGTRHALGIARQLLRHEPAGRGTDIAGALRTLNRLIRRRALVFLVSDFHDNGYARALAVTARRHDLIALTVLDPREIALPDVGLAHVEDSETGECVIVDLSDPDTRSIIRRRVAEATLRTDKNLRSAGVDRATLQVGTSYDASLYRLFARRERRM
jgi:uncharacterized protein (DUF58 family)